MAEDTVLPRTEGRSAETLVAGRYCQVIPIPAISYRSHCPHLIRKSPRTEAKAMDMDPCTLGFKSTVSRQHNKTILLFVQEL